MSPGLRVRRSRAATPEPTASAEPAAKSIEGRAGVTKSGEQARGRGGGAAHARELSEGSPRNVAKSRSCFWSHAQRRDQKRR